MRKRTIFTAAAVSTVGAWIGMWLGWLGPIGLTFQRGSDVAFGSLMLAITLAFVWRDA